MLFNETVRRFVSNSYAVRVYEAPLDTERHIIMGKAAQESCDPSQCSRFTVGHDAHGQWVVFDRMGLVGGLFKDRASAVHFALTESDRVPGDVCCVPDSEILDADMIFGPKPPMRLSQMPGH